MNGGDHQPRGPAEPGAVPQEGLTGPLCFLDISCVSASLNAVPSQCSIYLDRRLAWGETLDQVRKEMDGLIKGQGHWEAGPCTGDLHHLLERRPAGL